MRRGAYRPRTNLSSGVVSSPSTLLEDCLLLVAGEGNILSSSGDCGNVDGSVSRMNRRSLAISIT